MASSAPPPPRPRLIVSKPDPDAPLPTPLNPDLCDALRRKSTKPDPDAAPQDETTPLTKELCAALRQELEPSPDHHAHFARRLRLDHISAPPPPPPPSANPERASSSTARGRGRKRSRGTEMVRATLTADADHLSLRNLVRRARLTFEALRGRYIHGRHSRGDMRALSTMLSSKLCLYRDVRIVRCHDCNTSPSGKLYVYDGLYKVESSAPGKSGRGFNLVRVPGQDPLGSNTWRDAKKLTDALDSDIRPPGYLTLDLSRGKEAVRVPVCNTVDQDRSPLDDTEYLARPELPPAPPTLATSRSCCMYTETSWCGGRLPSSSCSCACVRRNGLGGPPYNNDGKLVRGMPVVYECGALCGCPASCPNRVTQRGMTHQLEVFRSKETEWGVRTLELIQPGAFICEFSGDLVPAADVGGSTGSSSYADPRKFPTRWKEWGDASAANNDEGPPLFPRCPEPAYVLDVSKRRNLASYICHSTAPNTFVQLVVRGDESESCPHLAVFAMEIIPPMGELSIDYGID